MKQKRVTEQDSNNNIDEIYFSIPNYSISKKLDYITFSIKRDDYTKLICSFLEFNGFKIKYNHKLKKGNYNMKRRYESHADITSVEIMHGVKVPLPNYPSLLIKIHDPNSEFLSLMDSFFKYHDIETKVSVIEMTFDFFTDKRFELFEFLKNNLSLKSCQTKPNTNYLTTFYVNDTRKLVKKSMRLYRTEFKKDGKKMVRLELIFKRGIIRELGLEFPLSNIDSLDLSKYFSFKFINEEKIKKHLYWKNRKRIEEAEKRRKGSGDLLKAVIDSWLSNTIDEEKPLLENLYELKSKKKMVPQYSRFIEPLDRFNHDFFEITSHNSFIQGKQILSSVS